MLNYVKKGLIAAGVLSLAAGQSVSAAALTAADVDMTTATSDIGVVFLAILGVTIIIFGYRKVMALANGR